MSKTLNICRCVANHSCCFTIHLRMATIEICKCPCHEQCNRPGHDSPSLPGPQQTTGLPTSFPHKTRGLRWVVMERTTMGFTFHWECTWNLLLSSWQCTERNLFIICLWAYVLCVAFSHFRFSASLYSIFIVRVALFTTWLALYFGAFRPRNNRKKNSLCMSLTAPTMLRQWTSNSWWRKTYRWIFFSILRSLSFPVKPNPRFATGWELSHPGDNDRSWSSPLDQHSHAQFFLYYMLTKIISPYRPWPL